MVKGNVARKTENNTKKKRESNAGLAAASSAIWGIRLNNAEKIKLHYREYAFKLLMENESLQSQICQVEWDTIEVLNYLKTQDGKKEESIDRLQTEVRELQKKHEKEISILTVDFQEQLSNLEDKLEAKRQEADSYHNDLKQVRQISAENKEMQKEIEELKEALRVADEQHQKTLEQIERKFFEDKFRFEEETNKKTFKLKREARQDAIKNLNDITKQIYQENARLSEALLTHIKDIESLRQSNNKFVKKYEFVKQELKEQKFLLHKKVKEVKNYKTENVELLQRIEDLEKSESDLVKEFETKKNDLVVECRKETECNKQEITQLQQVIETKSKELSHIKRLARSVLEQRNDLETFFAESLDYVRKKIAAHRKLYIQQAKQAYQHKLLEANNGKTEHPKVRTFTKPGTSTNNVYNDFDAAKLLNIADVQIDVKDLTWEQKESVLCYLFSRMNRNDKESSNANNLLPKVEPKKLLSIENPKKSFTRTFLTQAPFHRCLEKKLITTIQMA
ncbi:basal body-orientation factor 1 isoform X2 [Octopus bimaculoides]|uniref:Basal body-orientation factor 1 n=1 Tax=Octopus bimaculoides TaxID=37653 RepID=A0A0L8GBH5_OCTBM|nr:basal body-orientation factor 1 isoform X2 [Octopus bimaculoides]|eukprot:XP_014782441.1 PREDICTED: basal body-orientation factor 1-like isoform X2 [Octopus bimaculoides]